jgi:uncharacterized membrane protein YtjA (UPF0391 family)
MGLLGWALVAVVVALAAGLLGFGGIARGSARIAKFLFAIFLIVAAVLFIMQLLG